MKVLNDQPLQPNDSHIVQSNSKGLNEIRVLCEEQPPSTFARECLIFEFPIDMSATMIDEQIQLLAILYFATLSSRAYPSVAQ